MSIFGGTEFNDDVWGGTDDTEDSNFTPYIFTARFNDSGISAEVVSYKTEIFDVAFEFVEMLDAGQSESITAGNWASENSNLSVGATKISGTLFIARLNNQMAPGDTATLDCVVQTNIGQTFVRKLIVVSRFTPTQS